VSVDLDPSSIRIQKRAGLHSWDHLSCRICNSKLLEKVSPRTTSRFWFLRRVGGEFPM